MPSTHDALCAFGGFFHHAWDAFAVRKKTGTVWSYIDCSSLNDSLARKWFPDFPKEKKVPQG